MKILVSVFALLVAIVLVAYATKVPDAPYRTNWEDVCTHDDIETIDDACEENVFQELSESDRNGGPEFGLGFIEIDDQGNLHDRAQVDKVFAQIERYPPDLKIVVFIHGWKNSAAPNNKNVREFRTLLSNLSDVENEITVRGNILTRSDTTSYEAQQARLDLARLGIYEGLEEALRIGAYPEVYEKVKEMRATQWRDINKFSRTNILPRPSKIFGIYIGWRGLSHRTPVKELTFWSRKNAARRVGEGKVADVLLKLEDYLERKRIQAQESLLLAGEARWQPKLFVIGHSFGAAATYSALSQVYLDRYLQDCFRKYQGKPCLTRGYGDLVILVNLAFEALQYDELHELTSGDHAREFDEEQTPKLIIINSRGDMATKFAFPLGRQISTILDPDRGEDDQHVKNITSVGHYKPYQTHYLEESVNQTETERFSARDYVIDFAHVVEHWGKSYPLDFDSLKLTLTRITDENPHSPYLSINVDEKIIPDHSQIYDRRFLTFMLHMIHISESIGEVERGKRIDAFLAEQED